MYSLPQFERGRLGISRGGMTARLRVVLLGVGLLVPAVLWAQSAPAGAVARIEGADVSVEGGGATAAKDSTAGGAELRFQRQRGDGAHRAGEVDICGGRRSGYLRAGEDYGAGFGGVDYFGAEYRAHSLQLPAGSPVRVFTPTIIATPIDIGGATRDITLGLDLNDSLCVLAKSGALRLEQQFTGEGLIVPQAGDFLIAPGKLVPTAGVSGNCECAAMQAQSAPPPNIPLMGVSSASQLQMPEANAAPPPEANGKATILPPADPNVQLRVLAKEDEAHPVPQPEKSVPPPPPPTAMPIYKIVMPPLGFSASSPSPPEDPSLDAVLLVRTVHVEPEYEFSGHVDPPALVSTAPVAGAASTSASRKKEQKSGGFWAGLKRLFGGG